MEELEFGQTPLGEIIKSLRRMSSLGLFVEVHSSRTLGWQIRKMPAEMLLTDLKAILTYKKNCRRVFSLKTFRGTKVRRLTLLQSLDLQAERLCLLEKGNQYYFQNIFGDPKVQDC